MKESAKFTLKKEIVFDLTPIGFVEDCEFKTIFLGRKITVGAIRNNKLFIFKGYRWDGCTPKFRIFGELIGVPDFKGTYRASAFHDILIDFSDVHGLNRRQIDKVFELCLKQDKFFADFIYYGSVNAYREFFS